jgi:hypothetical protein
VNYTIEVSVLLRELELRRTPSKRRFSSKSTATISTRYEIASMNHPRNSEPLKHLLSDIPLTTTLSFDDGCDRFFLSLHTTVGTLTTTLSFDDGCDSYVSFGGTATVYCLHKNREKRHQDNQYHVHISLIPSPSVVSSMRNEERIPEILSALEDHWYEHPDQRLGQLIVNLTGEKDTFAVEDDELMRRLGEELSCELHLGDLEEEFFGDT